MGRQVIISLFFFLPSSADEVAEGQFEFFRPFGAEDQGFNAEMMDG